MDQQFAPIIIGIEDYDVPSIWKPLPKVSETARKLAELFGAAPIRFESGDATDIARVVKAAINALPNRATLVLHWIGHGVTAGDQHYLVCPGSLGPADLDGFSAVASGELGRLVARSRAEHILVILDTCFSGDGAGDLARRYRDNVAAELDREGWDRVACIVASSHPLDKAVAGRFSQGLLEALEHPDRHRRWTRAEEYIDPEKLTLATRDLLGNVNKAVFPRFSKEGLGSEILPNPLFRKATGNTDIETRRFFEEVFGEDAHFDLSARGIEAQQSGFFFSGRHRLLRNLGNWLASDKDGLTVVTGPPGSGKSAVIGRLVTLSVPQARAKAEAHGNLAPDDPRPPIDAVDAAVHAKGKDLFDCATACGRALGMHEPVLDGAGLTRLLETARGTSRPFVLVIDALDEAAERQAERIAVELISPLSRLPGVKVLVGTRRSLTGELIPVGEDRHGRLKAAFGSSATICDLADEPDADTDVGGFVAKRLEAARRRGQAGWIEDAARRVAAAAKGNFLYARLVTRSLEDTPDSTLDVLPADASAAFTEDVRARFPKAEARVTGMLRALAFGLGQGLSRKVWPVVAAALSEGALFDDGDVVFMLQHAGSYLVETSVETDGRHQAVYRLIHQALADHLKTGTLLASDLVFEALLLTLEEEAWLAADSYLARHLAEHAFLADLALGRYSGSIGSVIPQPDRIASPEWSAANRPALRLHLERLLNCPGFLAIAVPDELVRYLGFASDGTAVELRNLYRLAIRDLRRDGPLGRWANLHRAALTHRSHLAKYLAPPASAPWRCEWAWGRVAHPHLLLTGHKGGVTSVTLGTVDEQAIVVSGGCDGTVRRWRAATGVAIGTPLDSGRDRVSSVAMGTVEGRTVVASGSNDSYVRLWDATTGVSISPPPRHSRRG